jgi:hypothetical protein
LNFIFHEGALPWTGTFNNDINPRSEKTLKRAISFDDRPEDVDEWTGIDDGKKGFWT